MTALLRSYIYFLEGEQGEERGVQVTNMKIRISELSFFRFVLKGMNPYQQIFGQMSQY